MGLSAEDVDLIARAVLAAQGARADPVQIGSQLHAVVSSVTVTTASGVILARANVNRVHLAFGVVGGTAVNVAPTFLPTPTLGIPLAGALAYLQWSVQNDGVLPQLQWYGIVSAGTVPVLVIETIFVPPGGLL